MKAFESKLVTLSDEALETATGGGRFGDAVNAIAGAPDRFLNGYAYGTKGLGQTRNMGPLKSAAHGVTNGVNAMFAPSGDANRVGQDIRRNPGFWE